MNDSIFLVIDQDEENVDDMIVAAFTKKSSADWIVSRNPQRNLIVSEQIVYSSVKEMNEDIY